MTEKTVAYHRHRLRPGWWTLLTSQGSIACKIAIRGGLPAGEAPCSWRSRRPICRMPFLEHEGVCPLFYQTILDASSARGSPGSPPAGTLRGVIDVHFPTRHKRRKLESPTTTPLNQAVAFLAATDNFRWAKQGETFARKFLSTTQSTMTTV